MQQNKGRIQAAALKYDPDNNEAPSIVGVGEGFVAKKMLEAAEQNKIPVVEDETLAGVLSKLSVGDEIPEELYQVIAQVLVFIARVDHEGAQRYTMEQIKKGKRR